ncbi:hypothetical protein CAPTEDRAFT_174526 [Capitella teleta]|uniref:Mediator of RNA polymerase II transcription subunit 30 n=1 Tax=Capitella teleta TaxID=283909 RepID=R7VIC1_CAPTE|nr:hypothetical protein CAPTEDRAFT_174526 [Capitella teleta]|eukprot:ELU16046.1 hypothetical protein CAPTEDRAFT_174526 [Capitella teleta]
MEGPLAVNHHSSSSSSSQEPAPPPAPSLAPAPLAIPQQQVNAASLCRIGQELVHDIVLKASEIFVLLKNMQLPNGATTSQPQNYPETKAKLDDNMKQMLMNFKKLKILYIKVHEHTANLDSRPIEEMLPIEVNGEVKGEGPKLTDEVKYASEEHKEVISQLRNRNRELKQIIDKLRLTVWEINTMLATRKS